MLAAGLILPALAHQLGADLTVLGVSHRGPRARLLSRMTLDQALARLRRDVLAVRNQRGFSTDPAVLRS